MKIGIDVGGVLIRHDGKDQKEDTVFNTEDVRFFVDCKEVLEELKSKGHELYIISYCGPKREEETIKALKEYGIHRIIPEKNWSFVRSRGKKVDSCLQWNIDIMIDDRQDVHQNLFSKIPNIKGIWFDPPSNAQYSHRRLVLAYNWKDILSYFSKIKSTK